MPVTYGMGGRVGSNASNCRRRREEDDGWVGGVERVELRADEDAEEVRLHSRVPVCCVLAGYLPAGYVPGGYVPGGRLPPALPPGDR